jgi:hypothetical protein
MRAAVWLAHTVPNFVKGLVISKLANGTFEIA